MAFEALKAEIRDYLERTVDEPQDYHEMHQQLLQQLNELKASGMPIPDDLAALEAELTLRGDAAPEPDLG
jgi:hypothetical protein